MRHGKREKIKLIMVFIALHLYWQKIDSISFVNPNNKGISKLLDDCTYLNSIQIVSKYISI